MIRKVDLNLLAAVVVLGASKVLPKWREISNGWVMMAKSVEC